VLGGLRTNNPCTNCNMLRSTARVGLLGAQGNNPMDNSRSAIGEHAHDLIVIFSNSAIEVYEYDGYIVYNETHFQNIHILLGVSKMNRSGRKGRVVQLQNDEASPISGGYKDMAGGAME
jgi:hypothetical protein